MKKILIILTLLTTSLSVSFTQSLSVDNMSSCDVTFIAHLTDNSNCNVSYPQYIIPANSTVILPAIAGFSYNAAAIDNTINGGNWAFEIAPLCARRTGCPWIFPDFVSGPTNTGCQPFLSATWFACNLVRIY